MKILDFTSEILKLIHGPCYNGLMKTSQNGINLLKQFEGLKLKSYQDVVGIWTIGYGSTGPDIVKGLSWTQEQCEARLRSDLDKFEKAVISSLKVPVNQVQFDALVCFTYNVGIGAFQKSTMLKKINANDPSAADEFLRWNKAGGKVVAGLTNRRTAERALFLSQPQVQSKQEDVLPEGPSEKDMHDIFKDIEMKL